MSTLMICPTDLIILILQYLSVNELTAISQTCHLLHDLVEQYGWSIYLRNNPRPSYSLSQSRERWPPRYRVRYNFLSDCAWSESRFVARPLLHPWVGKYQPVLAISRHRLICAAGNSIYSYKFGISNREEAPTVQFEGKFSFPRRQDGVTDITTMTMLQDDGSTWNLCVGFQSGSVQYVTASAPPGPEAGKRLDATCSDMSHLHNNDFIESLSVDGDFLLSLSSRGNAMLRSVTELPHGWSRSNCVSLGVRSWTCHLCLQSSTPYTAFGSASKSPLTVYSAINSLLSPKPVAVLHASSPLGAQGEGPSYSAVYGICRAPLSSPWGSSPQLLISGWYDGQIRCYDLRSHSRIHDPEAQNSGPMPLRPILSLADPWSYDPVYSVACGGGYDSYVAAGSARHGVVSFWDLRSPRTGWSVHAPGNDHSPVYSIILESSRLFGATERRSFVYDFGPGVIKETYPPLRFVRGVDGSKISSGISYYVTKYNHTRSFFENEI